MGREQNRFNGYRNQDHGTMSDLGTVPFRGRHRFDDDFHDLPFKRYRSNYADIKLRFFRASQGDRVITNINKERPELKLLMKELEIKEGDLVLNLNAGDGVIGSTIAGRYSNNRVILMDSNLSEVAIAMRNTSINGLMNAEVIPGIGIQELEKMGGVHPNVIIYTPDKFTGYDLIEDQLVYAVNILEIGGKLYLLSHKKGGASRHLTLLQQCFGDRNVEIVGRGGGVRVIRAIKVSNSGEASTPNIHMAKINIFDKSYSFETGVSLFSKEGLDVGTRFLLENVDLLQGNRILDVGCGWGSIGLIAASINLTAQVTMFDVELRAVDSAQKNITRLNLDDRAQAIGTIDMMKDIPGSYDLVLSNPPFHQNYAILNELFKGVRDKTAKGSNIYVVVGNSYVPKFSEILGNLMGNCRVYKNNDKYTILVSRK